MYDGSYDAAFGPPSPHRVRLGDLLLSHDPELDYYGEWDESITYAFKVRQPVRRG